MSSFTSWFTAILMLLGGLVVLSHMGYNVAPVVGSVLHGVVRTLGHPLVLS